MECSICMCPLSEVPDIAADRPRKKRKTTVPPSKTESLTISTPCGHIFHRVCLKGWLKGTKGGCPSCRQQFTMKAAHPLFLDFQKMEPGPKADPLSQLVPAGAGSNASDTQDTPKQGTSHTDLQYFELEEKYTLLLKEHEALQEKFTTEKERADLNEALVDSLCQFKKEEKQTPTSNVLTGTVPMIKQTPTSDVLTGTVPMIKQTPITNVVTGTVPKIKQTPITKVVTGTVPKIKQTPITKVVTGTVPKIKQFPTTKVVTGTVPKIKLPKSNHAWTRVAGTLSQNKDGSSTFQPKKDNADNPTWFNNWWLGGDNDLNDDDLTRRHWW